MFEIDKTTFGKFLSEQRKKKGYTQKDLASKLFISDKAVSKWERGLSLPDISLLIPLSEILDITLTELLEGKKMDSISEIDTNHVETLVKKALLLSEETPEKKKEKQRKNRLIFSVCTLIAILELLVIHTTNHTPDPLTNNLYILELLSFIFGIHFWFTIKEQLPLYYDESKISTYSDGIFRMNIPGVSFNNSNWPYIIKTGRTWTAISLITIPLIYILLPALTLPWPTTITQTAITILYLVYCLIYIYSNPAGLFFHWTALASIADATASTLSAALPMKNYPAQFHYI